jgi:hypothetical protein
MAKNKQEPNPFVQALEIRARWRLIFKTEGGAEENISSRQTYGVALTDVDDRCPVYTSGLMSWFRDLSTSAKDMFMWIAMQLPLNQDYMEITEERYCKEMEVSRGTFYTAKTQLINRLLAVRTSRKNTYWVNPSYMYKGSRVDKFSDRVTPENEHPIYKTKDGKPPAGSEA